MEVLTFNGLPTILYLGLPDDEQTKRHAGYRGIGIAGIARSQTPQWMRENLPPVYAALASTGAPILHYKTCSTLDSAPHVGSIGTAIEIALETLRTGWIPFLVAAPAIRRFQAFGNLFAGYGDGIHRLDRHPVMSRHPVTPMDEGDVRRHLARQTDLPVGLVDLVSMKTGAAAARLESELAGGARIIALDTVDAETLAIAGALVARAMEEQGQTFCVGSQGIEYALCAHLQATGRLQTPQETPRAAATDCLPVVSGSVSPVTASQIAWAEANGFAVIGLDAARAVDIDAWNAEIESGIMQALAAIGQGLSPLVCTARGPDDPAVERLNTAIAGCDERAVHHRIGSGLGRILLGIVERTGLRRVVISGGDTSGHGISEFGIYALEALAPIAPGAPLCRAFSDRPDLTGLEVALKGGQMGETGFFGAVRAGGAP